MGDWEGGRGPRGPPLNTPLTTGDRIIRINIRTDSDSCIAQQSLSGNSCACVMLVLVDVFLD